VLRYSSSAIAVTLITVVYAGGQFLASPILGKIGDRYGRRLVLLTSLVGQALGYLVFGLGGSLWMLILGRLIGGITSGNLSTASAYIADISKPEERTKNFAIISTAWSMGLILGPALGGIFGQFSLQTPAFVAGGITIVNVILGFFLLPESLPKDKREKTPLRLSDLDPIHAIVEMARKPGLGLLILAYATFSFAFNGVNSTSALFMIDKFSAETWHLSVMMMLSGAAIAISNTFLVPVWVPRFGDRASGTTGLFGLSLVYTAVFFVPFLWPALVVNMLGSAMSALIFPSMTTLTIERVSPQEAGKLLGVTTAVGSLANIAGPLWAGVVYDHVMVGAPFWMGTIVLLATAWLFARAVPKPERMDMINTDE
jgi:multidrug resistance protein